MFKKLDLLIHILLPLDHSENEDNKPSENRLYGPQWIIQHALILRVFWARKREEDKYNHQKDLHANCTNDQLTVCTAYGTVEKKHLITPKDAVEGDIIVCTKNLGLEIAINLSFANESMAKNLFGTRGTRELRRSVETQSCVEDALFLGRTKGVHAMHDATEGD